MITKIFLSLLILIQVAFCQPMNPLPSFGDNTFTGTQTFSKGIGNYQPGTQSHLKFSVNSGYAYLDFYTQTNNIRSSIGADSNGNLRFITGNGYCSYFFSSTSSPYQHTALCSQGIWSYGYGGFQNGVFAGGTGTPTSKLEVQGNIGFDGEVVTASQTLNSSSSKTVILCDGSNAVGCVGSPAPCYTYTNSTTCNANGGHGGCNYQAYDCSQHSGDISACQSASCTPSESNCSDAGAYDQSSCESIDDSYGGNCTYENVPQDCSGYDEETCNNTSGCYPNMTACTVDYDPYDCSQHNGDETGCNNASSYNCAFSGDMYTCYKTSELFVSCSGGGSCSSYTDESTCASSTYYDSCGGSYDSYSCTGTYYTGGCGGTGNGSCVGTATCGNLNQSQCGLESGCALQTVLNLILHTGIPKRTYRIINDSETGADCVITPTGTDKVKGGTSFTLSNYKDEAWFTFMTRTKSCAEFNNNESSCNANSGCSWYGCNQYGDETSCSESGISCSWDSMNNICYGSTGTCGGNYIYKRNWY